jgi:hypothetical protein
MPKGGIDMATIIESARTIPVLLEMDVAVAGAGPAGFVAALAAARNGAKVVLIEKDNYIGGLLGCLGINQFFNFRGDQVVWGIAEEFVQRLVQGGASTGHIIDQRLGSVTLNDYEMLKVIAQEMALEAGVQPLFHAWAAAPVMEGNRVKGLFVEAKGGRQAILAKVVIDATGDGDIAAAAGADYEIKDRAHQQPGNLMFRMDHVNVDKIRLAIAADPDNARTVPVHVQGPEHFVKAKRFKVDGFVSQMERARSNGDVPADFPMRWVIIHALPREDEVGINMAMATHFQSVDALDLTRAEIEARRRIPIVVNFLKKHIPGFEKAALIASHNIIGVRESRRIIGDVVLQPEDVFQARRFPDGVAIASAALSYGHHPEGRIWGKELFEKFPRDNHPGCEVPYGCLLPKGIEGLLVAGRCISTTESSQNATRMMPSCMSTGQAAGTAAALAAGQGITPRAVDVPLLRQTLVSQGVKLMDQLYPIPHPMAQ